MCFASVAFPSAVGTATGRPPRMTAAEPNTAYVGADDAGSSASGRMLRIGELADQLGLTTRTLRHYEELGILPASERSPSGYRLYDARSVARLHRIDALKRLGLSLDEIAEVIDFYDGDPSGVAGKREVLKILQRQLTDTDDKIAALRDFRCELEDSISRVEGWLREADARPE